MFFHMLLQNVSLYNTILYSRMSSSYVCPGGDCSLQLSMPSQMLRPYFQGMWSQLGNKDRNS